MTTSQYQPSTEFLQKLARDAFNAARSYAVESNDSSGKDLAGGQYNHTVTGPGRFNPSFQDFFDYGDDNAGKIATARDNVEELVGKYFPAINECFRTSPEDVLCDIMKDRGATFSEAAFQQEYNLMRDRAYRAMRTANETIHADMTGRGFDMPQGVTAYAMMQVLNETSQLIAQGNADIMSKQVEVRLDLLKTAMSLGVQLKSALLGSIADFLRAMLSLPDSSVERARVRAQASAELYRALATMAQVEVAVEELKLRNAIAESDSKIQHERNLVAVYSNTKDNSEAKARRSQAVADIAAAAAAGAATLVAQVEAL